MEAGVTVEAASPADGELEQNVEAAWDWQHQGWDLLWSQQTQPLQAQILLPRIPLLTCFQNDA